MKKIAVILYGAPGSGKGMQADLLARRLGILHFDTGRFLESVVHDPARQREKIVRRERKLFDTGILMTPSFVLREVSRRVRDVRKVGLGVVFSGSPRTLFEAEGLIPLVEKLYGKRSIYIVVLEVPESVSMKRNGARLVCSTCRTPLLTRLFPRGAKQCPLCGGAFYRRSLDNPKVMSVRLKEYRNRTQPIFGYLRKRGYQVKKVDGTPLPFKVFKEVHGYIEKPR